MSGARANESAVGAPWMGVAAALSAFAIWGLSPIFYKALAHVPPLEVLSHRTLWSLAFIGGYALLTGRAGRIRATLADRRSALALSLAALLIAVNWFGFIYAVQVSRATEASLGYYIFPLLTVLLGVLVLREPLTRAQALAVALAAAAVTVLGLGLGAPPWIALILSGTMSLYGLVKKMIGVGPVSSVTIEALLLAPLALVWLGGVHLAGWHGVVDRPGGWFGSSWADTALLIASGPMTGGPLLLFAAAAQRLRYATLGLLQYLNPTLQFFCAVVVFGEVFTLWHGVAFGVIWSALAIYSASAFATDHSARRAARRAATARPSERE